MKKTILSIMLLASFTAVAQEFEWQWATRGGGTKNGQGEGGGFGFYSEQVIDIAVDDENNYYFLTLMTVNSTEYDGEEVTVYNPTDASSGMRDIVLISTDCEGTLLWTQTIGGGGADHAHKIILDNNGGLYIAANVQNTSTETFPDMREPPHFSPEVNLPLLPGNTTGIHEGYKSGFLLKYNTNDGSLDWYKALQGDVYIDTGNINISQPVIDSEGNLHLITGFYTGMHLDGLLEVPEEFDTSLQFFIVKFDTEGEVLNMTEIPMEGAFLEPHTDFRYDENLNRYYLAGFRNYGSGAYLNLTYDGTAFENQAYILAIDGTDGAEIWRKEITSESVFDDYRIYDLEIDSESNVYIAGKYFKDSDNPVYMDGYEFPDIYTGNVEYIMRLNTEGEVDWMKIPDAYTVSNFTGSHFAYDMVINEDEIGVAMQVSNEVWGDFSFNRPTNHMADPAIMRMDKATGNPLGVYDIWGPGGYLDCFTAIAVDNDGNYIGGGYFRHSLFTDDETDIPTLNKVGGQIDYTDFFIAKLASVACGEGGTANVDTPVKQGFVLYPNPADNLVTYEGRELAESYELLNMLGQCVQRGRLHTATGEIPLQEIHPGTYILRLRTVSGKTFTEKIIKK